MPYFTPPVVYDSPPSTSETSRGVLLYARHRPPQPRGRSVVKIAGVYTTVDGPPMELQNSAEVTYLGGHIYEITDEEAAALLAAGYSILLGIPGLITTEDDFDLETEDGDNLLSEYV